MTEGPLCVGSSKFNRPGHTLPRLTPSHSARHVLEEEEIRVAWL